MADADQRLSGRQAGLALGHGHWPLDLNHASGRS